MNPDERVAKIKAVFNAASDHFDAPALSFWNRFGQKTIDQLDLQRGDRVLDICCGTGASAIPAALKVGPTGKVIGIDLAESLMQLAQQKAHKQNLHNIEFQNQDFETLDFPSESFDAIVCVFGIFFATDMAAAIQRLWPMLRPGGTLAITSWGQQIFEPATQLFWAALEAERPDLINTFTPWEQISEPQTLKALLESGGATQVKVSAEQTSHPLASPEDWWTMALGGGFRGFIDQLDPAAKERVKQANLHPLHRQHIQSLAVEVLYATAKK